MHECEEASVSQRECHFDHRTHQEPSGAMRNGRTGCSELGYVRRDFCVLLCVCERKKRKCARCKGARGREFQFAVATRKAMSLSRVCVVLTCRYSTTAAALRDTSVCTCVMSLVSSWSGASPSST